MFEVLVDVPASPAAIARIRESLPEVELRLVGEPEERVRELPAEMLAGAEALFCTFPPANFSDMKRIRWVQIGSTGYSQLFGLGFAERGILATNGRGCFDIPIAEWTIAMMVNLARDLRQMIRNQDAAIWDRGAAFQREIRGLTVGLWGYGGIGRETARLAKALGMRIRVLTRNGVQPRDGVYCVEGTGDPAGVLPDRVFRAGEETGFLEGLDFLVIAMPLTKSTEGLVDERHLRAVPKSCFVLNPARGPIIREAALLRALEEGWIAGAALDTHYAYPLPPEHPLWRMPNVILTPHISGSSLSPRYQDRVWDIFVRNLHRYLWAEPLLNVLTADQLAGG
jgi:phosphoglycerate dehydrogenase-like enzyme